MKYITGAIVLMALLGEQEVSAVKIQTGFTDDLIKSLTEDLAKGDDQSVAQVDEKPKEAPKDTKKAAKSTKSDTLKDAKKAANKDSKAVKNAAKKEEEPKDEIPMDAAAIKAYSSVIADAAEDSEPAQPVQYS